MLAGGGGNLCILILGVVLVLPHWLRRNMLFYSVIAGTTRPSLPFTDTSVSDLAPRSGLLPTWLVTFGLFTKPLP